MNLILSFTYLNEVNGMESIDAISHRFQPGHRTVLLQNDLSLGIIEHVQYPQMHTTPTQSSFLFFVRFYGHSIRIFKCRQLRIEYFAYMSSFVQGVLFFWLVMPNLSGNRFWFTKRNMQL